MKRVDAISVSYKVGLMLQTIQKTYPGLWNEPECKIGKMYQELDNIAHKIRDELLILIQETENGQV